MRALFLSIVLVACGVACGGQLQPPPEQWGVDPAPTLVAGDDQPVAAPGHREQTPPAVAPAVSSKTDDSMVASAAVCSELLSAAPIGTITPIQADRRHFDVVASDIELSSGDHRLTITFSDLANTCKWRQRGVTPSSESFHGFDILNAPANPVGVYGPTSSVIEYSGSTSMSCPGDNSVGGSAAGQWTGTIEITERTATSVSGIIDSGGFKVRFVAPFCASAPPIPAAHGKCCAVPKQ